MSAFVSFGFAGAPEVADDATVAGSDITRTAGVRRKGWAGRGAVFLFETNDDGGSLSITQQHLSREAQQRLPIESSISHASDSQPIPPPRLAGRASRSVLAGW